MRLGFECESVKVAVQDAQPSRKQLANPVVHEAVAVTPHVSWTYVLLPLVIRVFGMHRRLPC